MLPTVTEIDVETLADQLQEASPRRILERALELYGDEIALSFSGAEDVLLIEYAHQIGAPFRIFTSAGPRK